MDESKSILKFLSLIEKVKYTTRHNWTKEGRQESVAEHTWRTCILFILMFETYDLKVDPYKLLKMLLIHDVHELTDGDLPGFIKENISTTYHNKELDANNFVYKDLPEKVKTNFLEVATEFENEDSNNAILARVCDRIETQLQHLNSGTKYWSKEEVGEHMLTYPEKYLTKLNDKNFDLLWDDIKGQLQKLTAQFEEQKRIYHWMLS